MIAGRLSDRLLALSREAHASRHHEAAYHALTAAMHTADDDADVAALEVIVEEARGQIEWLDQNDPAHRISTAGAAKHRHPGVYEMLIKQAQAHAEIHQHKVHGTP
jgi:membrane carboxypeptidase/penicillin-binding protein PbpC